MVSMRDISVPVNCEVREPMRLADFISTKNIPRSGKDIKSLISDHEKQARDLVKAASDEGFLDQADALRRNRLVVILGILIEHPRSRMAGIVGDLILNHVLTRNIIKAADAYPAYAQFLQKVYMRDFSTQKEDYAGQVYEFIGTLKKSMTANDLSWIMLLKKFEKPNKLCETLFVEEKTLGEYLAGEGVSISPGYFTARVCMDFNDLIWKNFSRLIISGKQIKREHFKEWVISQSLRHAADNDREEFARRFGAILMQFKMKDWFHKPFLEICKSILGDPPRWWDFPQVRDSDKHNYNELAGYLYYQYFKNMTRHIYDDLIQSNQMLKKELNRLRSRTHFWWNYRRSIIDIKIFLPSEEYHIISEEQDETGSTIRDKIESSSVIKVPICVLSFKDVIVIEYFRGIGPEYYSQIILKTEIESYTDISYDDIDDLRSSSTYVIRHNQRYHYQLADFLENNFNIRPDNWNSFRIYLPSSGDFDATWESSKPKMLKYYKQQMEDGVDTAVIDQDLL